MKYWHKVVPKPPRTPMYRVRVKFHHAATPPVPQRSHHGSAKSKHVLHIKAERLNVKITRAGHRPAIPNVFTGKSALHYSAVCRRTASVFPSRRLPIAGLYRSVSSSPSLSFSTHIPQARAAFQDGSAINHAATHSSAPPAGLI